MEMALWMPMRRARVPIRELCVAVSQILSPTAVGKRVTLQDLLAQQGAQIIRQSLLRRHRTVSLALKLSAAIVLQVSVAERHTRIHF